MQQESRRARFGCQSQITQQPGEVSRLSRSTIACTGAVLAVTIAAAVVPHGASADSYTVREGDSLSTIAAKRSTSVSALCRTNGFDEEIVLQPGQKLRIPGKSQPKSSIAYKVYQVREGDTLSEIACLFGVKLSTLLATADLDEGDTLQVGQKLRIPVPATAGPKGYLLLPTVDVQAGPGNDYEKTAVGAKGTSVRLTAKCNGWFRVRFDNGTQGWIRWDALKTDDGKRVARVAPPPAPAPRELKSLTAAETSPTPPTPASDAPAGTLLAVAKLHSGPSTKYPEAGVVAAGATCQLLGKALGWFKIRVGDGVVGWVSWDKLQTKSGEAVNVTGYPALPEDEHEGGGAVPSESLPRLTPASPAQGPAGPDPTPAIGLAEAGSASAEEDTDSREAVARALAAAGAPAKPRKAYVLTDGVNLRSGPGTEHERVASLRRGASVTVVGSQDGWYEAEVAPNKKGWVAAWLLGSTPPRSPTLIASAPPAGPGIHPFVSAAMRYRGVPYRRGGTTSRGFDCSGLVNRVLQTYGISAPRTAADLFGIGAPVPKDSLRSGDLVFFRNTYRRGISHVGIYIGDGKFIHASTYGRGVVVTELNSSYYARKYAGARRVR